MGTSWLAISLGGKCPVVLRQIKVLLCWQTLRLCLVFHGSRLRRYLQRFAAYGQFGILHDDARLRHALVDTDIAFLDEFRQGFINQFAGHRGVFGWLSGGHFGGDFFSYGVDQRYRHADLKIQQDFLHDRGRIGKITRAQALEAQTALDGGAIAAKAGAQIVEDKRATFAEYLDADMADDASYVLRVHGLRRNALALCYGLGHCGDAGQVQVGEAKAQLELVYLLAAALDAADVDAIAHLIKLARLDD